MGCQPNVVRTSFIDYLPTPVFGWDRSIWWWIEFIECNANDITSWWMARIFFGTMTKIDDPIVSWCQTQFCFPTQGKRRHYKPSIRQCSCWPLQNNPKGRPHIYSGNHTISLELMNVLDARVVRMWALTSQRRRMYPILRFQNHHTLFSLGFVEVLVIRNSHSSPWNQNSVGFGMNSTRRTYQLPTSCVGRYWVLLPSRKLYSSSSWVEYGVVVLCYTRFSTRGSMNSE